MKPFAIERLARLGRDPFALLIVVLAGLGTAHILARTATYGPAVIHDSIRFLSTAMNCLAGEGWRDFTGKPMIGWPPLFPLLLAAFGWLGIEPQAAGRWINATAFGLTILAAGCWLHSHLRSRWLGLAATATLTASLPLSHWMTRFVTEPLFVLFTLLALLQWAAFLHRRTDAPLWWAAGFTALAALTRWPGVVLIGTGVLLLLPLARLKQLLAFGAISSLPLLGVLAHNWAITGSLTEATRKKTLFARQSLSDGLSQIVEVFGKWVVPPHAPDGLAYLLCLVVGGVGLAGAAVVLRAIRMHRAGRWPDPEAAPAYFRLEPAVPFGVFAVAYSVFMVAVVPFTVQQSIDSRYLLPVYVPLLLAAVFLLDRFLSSEMAGRRVAVRYGLASLVLLASLAHIGLSARRNLRITAKAYAVGHESPATSWYVNPIFWQHSETLNYIKTNRMDGRIYSNTTFPVWSEESITAPGKYREIPRGRSGWTVIEAGAYIVWFDRFHNPARFRYDALDYRLLPDVETVADLSDGVILRRTTADPFDEARRLARKQRYVNQLIQQASEQVVRAGWHVYRTGRELTYVKKPCTLADVRAKFALYVTPADVADLPPHRQRYGSDNLDFYFDGRDVRRDNQCMEVIRLPDYPIRRIYIAQWISAENRTLWEAEFSVAED